MAHRFIHGFNAVLKVLADWFRNLAPWSPVNINPWLLSLIALTLRTGPCGRDGLRTAGIQLARLLVCWERG